ncbi:MAG: GUN4 domain-containing protein [Richelia sp. RM1_1_1]|nr:GUN4 domain-containing protein [Richelia sp. RM1_1_1]
MLLASMSRAYQNLEQQGKAEQKITESLEYLNNKGNQISSSEGLQTSVLVKVNQGKLLSDKYKKQAIKAYREAFNILINYPKETNPLKENQLLTSEDIELVHIALLGLINNENQLQFRQEIRDSLRKYLFGELEYFLKRQDWEEADKKTWKLMLFIANREKESSLDIPQVNNFPCSELKKIDDLWVENSGGKFGFSVQKKIWIKTGNRLGIKPSDWNNNDIEIIIISEPLLDGMPKKKNMGMK